MTKTLFRLPALAAIAVLTMAACGPVDEVAEEVSGPALWSLSDDDTTIFLFGTIHALKPDTAWRSAAFTAAFDSAETLYLEADVQSDSALADVNLALRRHALFNDGTVLDTYLSDDEEILIDQAVSLVGINPTEVENLRPWLISQDIAGLFSEKTGFQSNLGVDSALFQAARASGIEVGYLESAADVYDSLGSIADEETADMLVATANDIMQRPDLADQLVEMWLSQDLAGLDDIFQSGRAFGSAEVYRVLMTDRNADWVEQIDLLMQEQTGTLMIAVGAGHLAGPDSVQRMLRDRGYTVTLR